MDWSGLASQVIKLGAPILGTALGGPLGGTVGKVLADVLGAPDETPESVAEAIQTAPDASGALRQLEAERSDEWISVIKAGQELSVQLAKTEAERGPFHYAWRPAMSWLVVAITAQTFIIAPWMQGVFGLAVGTPYEQVLGISAIWLTIYGGGHTAKAIFGNRLGVR